jgi:hypothetical protein
MNEDTQLSGQPVALADRALLHERLGNTDAAEMDFKRFSELSSEDPRKIDRE